MTWPPGGSTSLLGKPCVIIARVTRPTCEAPREPTVLACIPWIAPRGPATRRSQLQASQRQSHASIIAPQEGRAVLVGTCWASLPSYCRGGRRRSGLVLDRITLGVRQA